MKFSTIVFALLLWPSTAAPLDGATCVAQGTCSANDQAAKGVALLQKRNAMDRKSMVVLEDSSHTRESSSDDASLVGYWSFEGQEAEKNPDFAKPSSTWEWKFSDKSSAGNYLHAWRNGYHMYARKLPGEGLDGSDAVGFGGRSAVKGTVPTFRTISFWARPDIGCCQRAYKIAFAQRADGIDYFHLFVHFGWLKARIGTWGSHVEAGKHVFPIQTESRWMHFAAVISDDKLEFYWDGELLDSKTHSLSDLISTAGDLSFQLGTGHPHNQYGGVVDEVKLFSEAKSAEDVKALMEERKCTDPAKSTWDGSSCVAVTSKLQIVDATSDHLVGHWRFDDPVGTRHWHDSSPRGIQLVSWRTSGHQHRFAESFDGVGLGGSGALRTWSRSCAQAPVPFVRSIAFWAKRDAGCCNRIINWASVKVGDGSVFTVWVHYQKLIVTVNSLDGMLSGTVSASYPIAEAGDSWDHIAATVEEGKVSLYLNGELKGSAEHFITGLDDSNATLQFGTCGPHHQFLGVADELRAYSMPLSAEDVAKLAATEGTKGVMEGENLPPIADPGPALTVWKPSASAVLEGSCTDQDSGPSAVTASWEVMSGPDTGALTIADASKASTEVSLGSAPAGDYTLKLTCSDGDEERASELTLVVFEAHESRTGATTETHSEPAFGFADAGAAAKPVALWLFDGDLKSSVDGGEDATVTKVRGNGEATFEDGGRFGGALELHCGDDYCVQLDLGNPEKDGPWPAMTVSLWFKTTKNNKLAFASKGGFGMSSLSDTGDEAWHHYVVTKSPDIQKAYLDGRMLYLKSGGEARDPADTAESLVFGITGGHASYGFDGFVDEIAVFDFVLSNEEVEGLYTQTALSFSVRGTMNPLWRGGYNKTLLEFFPDLAQDPDYTGYVGGPSPSTSSPAAYVHPRIFFTPDELPALRQRLRGSTVGRVAMENIRGLLRDQWGAWPGWLEERNVSIHDSEFGGLDQQLILESFRALVDGDSAMAARLGQQLDFMADEMHENLSAKLAAWWAKPWQTGGTQRDNSDTWKDIGQPILKRGTTVAFCYDWLYPWLQEGTRNKVRELIAAATQGTWSIGMSSLEAYSSLISNWLPWVTGDLILTMLAIENEDGFDTGVYASAAKAYRGWSTLGVSAVSGASYEGGGKNALTAPKYLALAKHGYPQYIAMPGPRKFATKFLLHTMLPNGLFFEDDLWGSVESRPQPADTAALKFAYPDDKVIDFVYRNSIRGGGYAGVHMDFGGGDGALPYQQLAPTRSGTYAYNNFITGVIYATDWTGPADWSEHAASAAAGQPLTYVAEDQGLLIARSAWGDEEAAWLLFNVRTLPGGHAAPGRGEFCFHAVGETWAFYTTGHNQEHSGQHSVILVDGEGQMQGVPGKFVMYQDSAEATFGTMDARHAYGIKAFGGTFNRETVNSYMIKPGPYKWEELEWSQLPSWYAGNSPGSPSHEPASSFPKAFRTVGLVRNPDQAYALVFDDIQKDDSVHDFAWRMILRSRYYEFVPNSGLHDLIKVDHGDFEANGNDFILKDSRGGAGRLLVRLLEGSSQHTFAGIATEEWSGMTHAPYLPDALQITAHEVSARFRILLYPLKDSTSPLPETSWNDGSSTLTVNGDKIKLTVTDEGATVLKSLKVAGKSVSLTTNEVFEG